MSRPKNQTELLKRCGFDIKNVQWAWCAVSVERKEVIFTAWADNHIGDMTYRLLAHEYTTQAGGGDLLGYKDALEKLKLVKSEGYKAFMMIKTARNVKEVPRVMARLKTDAILEVDIFEDDEGVVYGKVIGKRSVK